MAIPTLKARKKFKQRLFLGLAIKPLRLFCESCGKYVPSDMEWSCGYCNAHNHRTKLYSFLRKCQHCKRVPKLYICPHCERPNFLGKDKDGQHPARHISMPPRIITEERQRLQRIEELKHQKDTKEHEVEIAKLDAELLKFKQSTEFKQEKTVREKIEENFSEFEANVMGAQMFAKARTEHFEKEYANDPFMLEQSKLMLKDWLNRQTDR
jgi:hypothetical protein